MVENLPANAGDTGSIPGSGDALEEEMAPLSNILAWKSHGQRSLEDHSPWGHKESDTTEHTGKRMRKERVCVCVCVCARVCWAGVGDVCSRGDQKTLRKKFQKRGGQKQHGPKKVQQGRKQVTCVTRETWEEGCVRSKVGSRGSEGPLKEGQRQCLGWSVPDGIPAELPCSRNRWA